MKQFQDGKRDNFGQGIKCRGFTLVEILIVVVILGILASIVIPKFANATEDSRVTATQMNLRHIRMQVERYRVEHGGHNPALATFEEQMTLATNIQGQSAALGTSGYNLGPYLKSIPVNPYTGAAEIGAGAVGDSDWYYNETTGEFKANDSEESNAL